MTAIQETTKMTQQRYTIDKTILANYNSYTYEIVVTRHNTNNNSDGDLDIPHLHIHSESTITLYLYIHTFKTQSITRLLSTVIETTTFTTQN